MAKSLGALAALLQDAELTGDANIEIKGIEHDSRKAAEGTLFVCIKGAHVDGHKFIPQAKAQGAVAIMTEEDIEACSQLWRKLCHFSMIIQPSACGLSALLVLTAKPPSAICCGLCSVAWDAVWASLALSR